MTIKQCVIPAAGKGNRIAELPLTQIYPKPMLPILNKPLLEYVIENAKKFRVETIYIIVGHRKEVIKEYFQDGENWDVEISYVEQPKPTGISNALGLVKGYVDEPFLVILGDDLTVVNSFNNFTETFFKHKAWVVEGVVSEEDVETLKRTCCVHLNSEGRIERIVEKPAYPNSRMRGIGVYLFDPIIFSFIEKTPVSPKRKEKELTDTIALIAKKGKAFGCPIDGVNINVNTFEDLMTATQIFLRKSKEMKKQPSKNPSTMRSCKTQAPIDYNIQSHYHF
jgi:NDP-sugar pyrophosphorylase family protein